MMTALVIWRSAARHKADVIDVKKVVCFDSKTAHEVERFQGGRFSIVFGLLQCPLVGSRLVVNLSRFSRSCEEFPRNKDNDLRSPEVAQLPCHDQDRPKMSAQQIA